jgi:hypothetical protein
LLLNCGTGSPIINFSIALVHNREAKLVLLVYLLVVVEIINLLLMHFWVHSILGSCNHDSLYSLTGGGERIGEGDYGLLKWQNITLPKTMPSFLISTVHSA